MTVYCHSIVKQKNQKCLDTESGDAITRHDEFGEA